LWSENTAQHLILTLASEGAQNMKQIQKWFELIAGIRPEELARAERAREIFAPAKLDIRSLHTPACWRRQCRITRTQA
jgi:hypothetical protein